MQCLHKVKAAFLQIAHTPFITLNTDENINANLQPKYKHYAGKTLLLLKTCFNEREDYRDHEEYESVSPKPLE